MFWKKKKIRRFKHITSIDLQDLKDSSTSRLLNSIMIHSSELEEKYNRILEQIDEEQKIRGKNGTN